MIVAQPSLQPSLQPLLFGQEELAPIAPIAPMSAEELAEFWRLRQQLAERARKVSSSLAGPHTRPIHYRKHVRLATTSSRAVDRDGTALQHTVRSRRLYNLLTLIVQRIYKELDPQEQAHVLAFGLPPLRLHIRDLMTNLHMRTRHAQRVVEAFNLLYALDLQFEQYVVDAPAAGGPSSGQWMRTRLRLIESFTAPFERDSEGIPVEEGVVEVRFGVRAIRVMVEDPVEWARLDYRVVVSLQKQASIGLYELCCQGAWRRERMTAPIEVERLARVLSVGYRGWPDFCRHSLEPTIDELNANEYVPFFTTMETQRTGLRVDALRFSTQPKVAPRSGSAAWSEDTTQALAALLGSQPRALEALHEHFTEAQVRSALPRLRARLKRGGAHNEIVDPVAYLRAVLIRDSATRDNDPGPRTASSGQAGENASGAAGAQPAAPSAVASRSTGRAHARANLPQAQSSQDALARAKDRLFEHPELLRFRKAFEDDQSLPQPVRDWISQGWDAPGKGLRVAFANWVCVHEQPLVAQILAQGA